MLRAAGGARRLILDERAIPIASEPVAGGPYDFREPRAIGALALDDCFCELARGADGRARVTLANERHGLALWLEEAYPYAMVYSGDTLAPDRRRRGLAVEPMTCAPNAFASGDGARAPSRRPGVARRGVGIEPVSAAAARRRSAPVGRQVPKPEPRPAPGAPAYLPAPADARTSRRRRRATVGTAETRSRGPEHAAAERRRREGPR